MNSYSEEKSNGGMALARCIHNDFCFANSVIGAKHSKKTEETLVEFVFVEVIPMLIANGLRIYYDSLPGYGIMPGLTYIGEVLYSYGASIIYCVLFVISVLCCIASPKE